MAKFDRAGAPTRAIAADFTRLKDQVAAGMTQEHVDGLQAKFESQAARLEALDAENPTGEVPPV